MSKPESISVLIEEQPDGEVKDVLEDALRLVQEIDSLQAEYNALTDKERENLPKEVHLFFSDEVVNFNEKVV